MIETQSEDAVLKVGKSPFQDESIPSDLSVGCMVYQQSAPEKDTHRTLNWIRPDKLFSLFTADIIQKNTDFVR